MTNEIKEILDLFYNEYPKETKKLEKYITNLQKRKQRLLESADCLSKCYNDLERRIDTALYKISKLNPNEIPCWLDEIETTLRGDE